jgi:outer membrane protein
MNRSFALIPFLASGLVLSAVAQPSPAPAVAGGPVKVAIIAMQTAVTSTNEFRRNYADLQKKYEPKRAEFKTLSDELVALNKQLQASGGTMSEAERASKTKVLEAKKKQAKRLAEDSQTGFQQEMHELYNLTASKLYEVLASYAHQQGLTAVLDVSEEHSPVLYASESSNITKQVTEAYNAKSGVPAPPAQPAVTH